MAATISALSIAGTFSQSKPSIGNPLASAVSGSYMENRGQWDPRVLFYTDAPGIRMWATHTGMVIDAYRYESIIDPDLTKGLQSRKTKHYGHVFSLDFVGASTTSTGVGSDPRALTVDFLGMGERKDAQGVKQYESALVKNLYPGVDMRLYRDESGPRYDLIVAPGTDASKVRMAVHGALGVNRLANGSLSIATIVGQVELKDLKAYQMNGGQKVMVPARFAANGKGVIGFELGNYDHSRPLVIDPLVYGSHFGGNAGSDDVLGMVSDGNGNVYATGLTTSTDLPITDGPYGTEFLTDGDPADLDGWMCAIQGDAYNVTYVCYVGGPGSDRTELVQVDQYGNVWLAGETTSEKFLEGGQWTLHQVEFRDITGGDFLLTYRGQPTDPIAWNATAQDVADALNALDPSILPVGGFAATGGPLPTNDVTITANGVVFPIRLVQRTRPYLVQSTDGFDPTANQQVFMDTGGIGWIPNRGSFMLALDPNFNDITDPMPFDVDGIGMVIALSALPPLAANPPMILLLGQQGPLPDTPIDLFFNGGPPNFTDAPRDLIIPVNNFADPVDGGRLQIVATPPRSFVTKFSPSTTKVLDPFINKVVKTFPGATNTTAFSIRPNTIASGNVEMVLGGSGGTIAGVQGNPPPGSGPNPEHGFLLVLRYVQGSTTVSALSSRSFYIGGRADANVSSVFMDQDGAVYAAGNVWLPDPSDPNVPPANTNATLGPNSNVFFTSTGVFVNGGLLRKQDGWVRKYNANGTYAYSAVFGGSGDDRIAAMTIDGAGNMYLTGDAGSFNFPRTVGGFDQSFTGASEPFVSKISATASVILYSTGLNHPNASATGIAVDSKGNAYTCGITVKPLVGEGISLTPVAPFLTGQEAALDPVNAGGFDLDGYLTVLNSTAVGLLYSSYIGNSASQEVANQVHTDRTGSVWVCGSTNVFALGPTGLNTAYKSPLAFKPFDDGSDGWFIKMRFVLPVLQSISINPNQVAGGLGSTADVQVTLRQPAPPGGTTVTLRIVDATYARFNTSNGPSLLRITVPAGATQFTTPAVVATRIVTAPTSTEIRAELDGDFVQDRLNIRPWIESFLLSTGSTIGGQIIDGTVTIFQPAAAGGVDVQLSADSNLITFPNGAIVTIPAGALSVSVPIQTGSVAVPTDVNITATVANVSITQPLHLDPSEIDTLIVNPNRVSGGEPSQGTVILNAPVAVNTVINLSQIGAPVTIPATVTVPAGQSQVNFPIGTSFVSTNTSTRIIGELNGLQAFDTLFIDNTDIASVVLTSYDVLGGAIVDGRVNLTRPAGPTGLNIPMITDNPTGGSIVPVTVSVSPGATFGTFQVFTNVVPVTQNMRVITNKPGYNNTGRTLQVRALSVTLTFNPTTVVGGIQNSTGTITLNNNEVAPNGGLLVNLSSSAAAALAVPATVTVPAGQRSVTFTATSSATSFDRNVTITANLAPGNSVSAVVRVLAPRVTTLTISPVAVTGGQSAIGTVRVDAPAPAGGLTMSLTSNTTKATVPATVTIPAGQTSANFTINTSPVAAKVNATIRAIGFSTSQSAVLEIYPPSVSSFTFNPPSVRGGQSSTGTITVNGPAPVGGLVITLTNNNAAFVSHPTTVTIPAGQTSVSFTCGTNLVTRSIAVKITASIPDRGPVNAFLTITPTP